ncbi:MAG: hypothetical protein ACK5W9_09630, partial [Bdellovibrionales bacterium]
FINRFNALVAPSTAAFTVQNSTAVPVDSATTGMPDIGGAPWTRDYYDVGPAAEPAFTVASIPANYHIAGGAFTGEGAITATFHVLHRLAMQLTRVRRTRHFYSLNSYDVLEIGSTRTALKSGMELYFPPPAIPAPGSNVTLAQLDAFLTTLRAEVDARRNGFGFAHVTLSSCHNSCHTSCHSSRSRR